MNSKIATQFYFVALELQDLGFIVSEEIFKADENHYFCEIRYDGEAFKLVYNNGDWSIEEALN